VFVKNHLDNVVVKNNRFESAVAPERGAWIVVKDNPDGVTHRGNTSSPLPIPLTKPMR
jgi:hypothetical protein